jgi:8-oxo-dGTP diphosphatase
MSGSTPNTAPEIHVVAGVLARGGKIFITHRPPNTHQGGLWEFPGGKVARGESAWQALQRELHEELGIEVLEARPIVEIHHRYPDKAIWLDVWRVTAFRGEPHGREGQAARWADPGELSIADFPAADRPVLRRLQLPPLYLISDAGRYGKAPFRRLLERALAAGARLVQAREPGMPESEFIAWARDLAALCHTHGAKLLINGEPSWVERCGADGVHLNARRLMALNARPLGTEQLVAASCHDRDELAQAARLDCDFAVLSPVAPTESHPHIPPLGWERFGSLVRGVPLPVYALGGMTPKDIGSARAAGAQGLAMIRGVFDVPSVEAAVSAVQVAAASDR